MRIFDKANLIEEELQDLKLRFELLEGDRKAYYETSQWNIRQNKEEITRLKSKNKQTAEEISLIKKYDVSLESAKTKTNVTAVEKLDMKIHEVHKRYDELLAQNRTREEKVQQLEEQLTLLKQEESLVKAMEQDSDSAKEIQVLENKLDKANIKFTEAMTMKKIYDQIIKILEAERARFDNQLIAFERTIKMKRQDAIELESMAKDADVAKTVARSELSQFEANIASERREREREVNRLKELIKQKRQMDEKSERRAFKTIDETSGANEAKNEVDPKKMKEFAEYEDAIKVIKDATGISNVEEIVQKFQNQRDTHERLKQLKMQNESRLEETRKKHLEMQTLQDDLRQAAESKHNHSKRLIREFNEQLKLVTSDYNDSKERFDRATKLLADMKLGIQHLVDKLDGVPLTDKPPKYEMSDENLKSILDVCFRKIIQLHETISNRESSEGELPVPPISITQAVLPQHNIRVRPQTNNFDADEIDEEINDDSEIPDRETLKRYTAQMLNARTKAKQPKKRKKAGRKDQDDDSS